MINAGIEHIDSLSVPTPWLLVEVIEGVSKDASYTVGLAEVDVDIKAQGEYMNICQVLQAPSDQTGTQIMAGDFVCVWAPAIKRFTLMHYGEIILTRIPDVFLVIPRTSALGDKLLARYHEHGT